MATITSHYPGEHCKRLGLTIDQFYGASTSPPAVKIVDIKNGPIYELSQVRRLRGTPWIVFYEAVKSVCDSSFTTTFNSFKVMVGRLEKRRSALIRNKQKNEVEILLQEPFCGEHAPSTSCDDSVSREQAKTDELFTKLQTLSVRNVN